MPVNPRDTACAVSAHWSAVETRLSRDLRNLDE